MASASRLSVPLSIPVDAGVMDGALQLLSRVEMLPPEATGALSFGAHGVILVESRKVCWAVAADMTRRLARLLLQQRNPPLDERYVERVLRECQITGKPLGAALLSTGQISEEGLRAALFSHVTEAIARIAHSGACCDGFTPHVGEGYDPRFEFSTAEIFVALGARRDRALAAAARGQLRAALVPNARGLAFVRDARGPVPIAVEGNPTFRIPEMLDLCAWACGVFDVSSVFDEDVRIAAGTSGDSDAAVTWRQGQLQYVAVCSSRAASAVMLARLNDTVPNQLEAGL